MQAQLKTGLGIIILFSFQLFILQIASGGELIRLSPWHKIRTSFVTVKYKSRQDLIQFHTSIKFGPYAWNKTEKLGPLSDSQYEDMLKKKVDAIFLRAGEILDMKKRFNPVNINLYPNASSLKKAFQSIYQEKCTLRAWYRFKNNTVYLNIQDLHEGMLAHELAHSIIDHYLTVKPPPQAAEILARYVDSHLKRGFIN